MINVTSVVKNRVKDMVETLLPDVGYVKVKNSGLVVLKKRWYSFKKVTTTVTDLLIGVLPEKISEFTVNRNDGVNYLRVFNEHISMMLALRAYNSMFNICDYVWDQYNKHCVIVPEIVIRTDKEVLFLKKHNYLPVKSPFSTVKVKELFQYLNGTTNDGVSKRFKRRLEQMKNNLPARVITIFRLDSPILTTG